MKKKKALKGMTLMEIIIAMLVMVICGAILVEACVSVVTNTRTARTVISKVDEQAAVIENRPSTVTAYEEGASLSISYNGASGNPILIDKFEAPTTQVAEQSRSGNLKYFEPAVTH